MERQSLLLGALVLIGATLVGIGLYSILKPDSNEPQNFKTAIPVREPPVPTLVKKYADGLGWTINPPSHMPCQSLPTVPPSVQINKDGTELKMAVPAYLDRGLAARDEQGREFNLKIGDEFEITTTGKIKFSNDHPCVDANGMYGWYDSHVDSPFNQNVGGLEFSIGNLMENRYFAGTNYKGTAEANGVFIARVIEQSKGYSDNNEGAFIVTVRKIK